MSTKTFDAKAFLKKVPTTPGVYQFYDAEGKLLYVGKAKMELFSVVSEKSSFIFIWAIGYEILAAIFFIFIAKLFIDALNTNKHSGQFNQKFRRP